MADIFTETMLSDGTKIEVLQLRPSMLWRASHQFNSQKETEYDMIPFLLSQCLSSNGKLLSIKEIDEIEIGDYNKVNEIVCLMMNKEPLF